MKKTPSVLLGIVTVIALLLGLWVHTLQNVIAADHVINEKLKSQLMDVEALLKLKALPLTVTTRKALAGAGKVLQVQNRGGDGLRLTIVLHNAQNQTSSTEAGIDPNQTREIGHMEGWAFVTGDEVAIASPGYRTERWKVE